MAYKPKRSVPAASRAMPIEAVIFDCDGTLVDSEGLQQEALVECLRELGHGLSVAEAGARYTGWRMADCLEDLEQRLARALPPDFERTVRARTAGVFRQRLRPIAGAGEVLAQLRIPYCIASSGPREKIELSLSLTGLLPYFRDRIFSAYEVGAWKPDPGLFLHAARSMGVAPARCAVVEDSEPGIRAGLAAGMTVFALLAEGGERLAALESVQILRRLADLPALLASAP